jgi:hypothetical protein
MYKDAEDAQDPKIIEVLYRPVRDTWYKKGPSGMSNRDFSLRYSDPYLCTKVHGFFSSQWLILSRRLASEMAYFDLASN